MKQTKFRAWDSEENKMMPVEIIDWKNDLCTVNEGDNTITDHIEMFTLMQFTGLKDKNGIDIYESDIVKSNYFKNGLVTFWQYGWHFNVSESNHSFNTARHSFEIIGNLYENPELLTI